MSFLRKLIFWLVFLFILWIAASLIALNKDIVSIDILFMKLDIKIGVALLTSFALGWLFGIMSMLIPVMKGWNKGRVLKKEKEKAEKEVKKLRESPFNDVT